MHNAIRTRFCLFPLLTALSAATSHAAPEWRHAANHTLKLCGGILLGDERGTYWGEELPPGWVWIEGYQKPGNDYLEFDALNPKLENGQVIFNPSRWNFIIMLRTEGLPDDQVEERLFQIDQLREVRWLAQAELMIARKEFEEPVLPAIETLLNGAKSSVDFPCVATGLLAVETTGRKWARVLVENYSMTGAVTFVLAPKGTPAQEIPERRLVVRDLMDTWNLDIDKDGAADLTWVPSDETRSSCFKAASRIVLVKTY